MVFCSFLVKRCRMFSGYNGACLLIEPPKKLNRALYRCDIRFELDIILDMFEDEIKYGIVMISGKEYSIYVAIHSGDHIEYQILKSKQIYQPNKHNKGGMSQMRYLRIRGIVHGHFVDQIAEDCVSAFMKNNHIESIITKLVIAGPASIKTEVTQTDIFMKHLTPYLIKIVTTPDIDIASAKYALDNSIGDSLIMDMKKIDNEIDELIQTHYDYLVFGEKDCIDMIAQRFIKKLYVTEEYNIIYNAILNDVKTDGNTDICITKSEKLKQFGGIIAIKKFIQLNDDLVE